MTTDSTARTLARRLPAALASLLLVVPVLLSVAAANGSASTTGPVTVGGRGVATFEQDLDPSQDVAGCSFVLRATGAPTGPDATASTSAGDSIGTFDCRLSPETQADLPFSSIHGDLATISRAGANVFTVVGTASVGLPDGTTMDDVSLEVAAGKGGVDQGWLRITLPGLWDGAAGDSLPGNGDYDLYPQTVTAGRIGMQAPTPSTTPSVSPDPSPSVTPSPTVSPTATPSGGTTGTGTGTGTGTTGTGGTLPGPPPSLTPPIVPGGTPPFVLGGPHSTADLMAILADLSPNGQPRLGDILEVVAPFPVAGLAWWQNDWHAYRCCPYPHLHQGLDMFAERGTPVVASADGVISQKVVDPRMSGLGIEITDARNTQYFYAHLDRFARGMRVGARVHLGQVLGYVGNTGDAAGGPTHLHFEIQPNGVPEPPMPIVDNWLTIAIDRATTLYEQRTGRAYTPSASLPLWISRADQLASGATRERADQQVLAHPLTHPFRIHLSSRAARTLAGGASGVLAGGLLLLFLLGPARVASRRRTRLHERAARRTERRVIALERRAAEVALAAERRPTAKPARRHGRWRGHRRAATAPIRLDARPPRQGWRRTSRPRAHRRHRAAETPAAR